jgi:hypothetical protein
MALDSFLAKKIDLRGLGVKKVRIVCVHQATNGTINASVSDMDAGGGRDRA